MNTLIIGPWQSVVKPESRAKRLSPEERRELAVSVLARTEPVTTLAEQNRVSRKFLYSQASKAREALDDAFNVPSQEGDARVLFYIPVTKQWLLQVVLALVLICRSSIRGVCEFFATILDSRISIGTVHGILHQAALRARRVNEHEELSSIRAGAHDEIFQAEKPVLAGVDPASTYCYLLAKADHRDADTWAIHLMDLQDRGLKPDYTVGDGGMGLRSGQAEAWPDVPCRGDVFHPLRDLGRLCVFLENRVKGARSRVEKIEDKIIWRMRRGLDPGGYYKEADRRRSEANKLTNLAEAVSTLTTWLREDILPLVGPDYDTRQELLDFVIEELKQRESQYPRKIGPVRRSLEHQRENLLAFAKALDEELRAIASAFHIHPSLVREVYELQGLPNDDSSKWQKRAKLHARLGHAFHPVEAAVNDALACTVRASSIVENLNSRLRSYFFLRRHLNQPYLDLLRYFLNHRRFLRSERPERAGKSPVEILTGHPYPHWLEELGFELYRKAA